MHPHDWRLINGELIEAIPAVLARARGNATARMLATSEWLLRRKADGRFLATRQGDTVTELFRHALPRRLLDDVYHLAHADFAADAPRELFGLLPRLRALGLDEAGYAANTGLPLVAEPHVLAYAGTDRYSRPLWLASAVAQAWHAMRVAASHEGIVIEAISGYRSHDYQLGIFRRKLARGQTVADILAVNAAPGFSEHHSGRALDIGTPGEPAAEESFENTPAFAWLTRHADEFGFVMSYPRENPHGIVYEPWHWIWQASVAA